MVINMKKLTALILMSVVLLCLFAACNNTSDNPPENYNPSPEITNGGYYNVIDTSDENIHGGNNAQDIENGRNDENSDDGDNIQDLTLAERIFAHIESEFFNPPFLFEIPEGELHRYQVNPRDAVSFVAKMEAISAHFFRIIIIEAEEDRLNYVYEAMLLHQEELQDAAFYPQGRVAAANSIVAVRGNVVYLICDERAAEIEESLLEYFYALELEVMAESEYEYEYSDSDYFGEYPENSNEETENQP